MIRVFSFVASCAGEKSRTARYSDALAQVLAKKAEACGERIHYEHLTGSDLRIEFCRSCASCFMKGFCPLDSVDDIPVLKRKLLESDIILFGSPVYLAEMSGVAKCVLDRITYWTHRFELTGKVGFAFTTTSSSYGPETAEHLRELLTYTGLAMIRSAYAVTTHGQPNLYREQEMASELDAIADELLSAWQNPAAYVTPKQEAMRAGRTLLDRRNRRIFDLIGIEPWNETLVCEARRIGEFPSFAAMVTQMKGRVWDDIALADQEEEHGQI